LDKFIAEFSISDATFNNFISFTASKGVKATYKELFRSKSSMKVQMKAMIARQYFKNEGYYRVMKELDSSLTKSIALLSAE
jgi:carboxyl-terminal processing protease